MSSSSSSSLASSSNTIPTITTSVAAALPITVANWLCNDLISIISNKNSNGECGSDDNNKGSDIEDGTKRSTAPAMIRTDEFGELVALVVLRKISRNNGRKLLTILLEQNNQLNLNHGKSVMTPSEIMEAKGWGLITDRTHLLTICRNVVSSVIADDNDDDNEDENIKIDNHNDDDPSKERQRQQEQKQQQQKSFLKTYAKDNERKRKKTLRFLLGKVMEFSKGRADPEMAGIVLTEVIKDCIPGL